MQPDTKSITASLVLFAILVLSVCLSVSVCGNVCGCVSVYRGVSASVTVSSVYDTYYFPIPERKISVRTVTLFPIIIIFGVQNFRQFCPPKFFHRFLISPYNSQEKYVLT